MSQHLNELRALLARTQITDGGDPVFDLRIEPAADGTAKFIRGYIEEPGPNGIRRQACCWMPSGKARVGGPLLNLSFPNPLT